VEILTGFTLGFESCHRSGKIGIRGVAGVEAVAGEAKGLRAAIIDGPGGAAGHFAGVGLLVKRTLPVGQRLTALRSHLKTSLITQGLAVIDRASRGAVVTRLILPAVACD